MQLIKVIFTIVLAFSIHWASHAQKQTFDVVSFAAPKGWQQTQNEGGVQLSITDKKSGAYAIAVITKATASTAAANENFNTDWNRLVKGSVQVKEEPAMQAPVHENGWDIVSGSASFIDGATQGVATLLTATSNGQMVSVLLMTNTQQYQNDLLTLINSLSLSKAAPNTNNTQANTNNTNRSSIVGLWVHYTTESNGYSNGFPQLTGGYMRREYAFYPDGTYLFRVKDWMVYVKDILFVYESGTWAINGNQLTITPKQGKGGWWNKAASGRTSEWGSAAKTSTWKLEPVTYTFDFHYYAGTNETSLILTSSKQTEREGRQENNTLIYSPRALDKTLIDNPPGFKTGFENKSLTAAATTQPNNIATANRGSSPLTGKIWEGTATEKFPNSSGTNFNTGGFSTNQYRFNADGTYRFVNVLASHYTNTKTLGYETGTWSLNGNQLTVVPTKGYNEEWSKTGKTSNGNSDVTNRAINETWNKKLKTSARKLESYTYTFSVGKNGDKTALILQRSGRTEREGEGSVAYLNETAPEKSVKLPAGVY